MMNTQNPAPIPEIFTAAAKAEKLLILWQHGPRLPLYTNSKKNSIQTNNG